MLSFTNCRANSHHLFTATPAKLIIAATLLEILEVNVLRQWANTSGTDCPTAKFFKSNKDQSGAVNVILNFITAALTTVFHRVVKDSIVDVQILNGHLFLCITSKYHKLKLLAIKSKSLCIKRKQLCLIKQSYETNPPNKLLFVLWILQVVS